MSNTWVTFETKCYENDWRELLLNGRLEKMIEVCNYDFATRQLIINNVDDVKRVRKEADKLIRSGVIHNYYIADFYSKEVLDFFKIEKDSFNGGYYYSISELTGIYFCETDFLLHFSSDTILNKNDVNWIDAAMDTMLKDKAILVANPTWNNKFNEAKDESFKQADNWYYSQGFSDQCYLIAPRLFKKIDYNEKNKASERFPKRGGELFEKRVDAYMRNHDLFRITNMDVAYTHKNFEIKKKSLLSRIFKTSH
jgi:hypothetical protein